jgi:hypothetical protein
MAYRKPHHVFLLLDAHEQNGCGPLPKFSAVLEMALQSEGCVDFASKMGIL